MKESTKQKRHNQKLAELLGISVAEVEASRRKQNSEDKIREVQAVLLFMETPSAFLRKECAECGQLFMTTYKYVSNCSTRCRIKSLKRIGIDYDPTKTPEERWRRTQIPTEYSIPPEALQVLISLAQEQKTEHDASSNTHYQSNIEAQTIPNGELDLSTIDEFLDGLDL